MSKISERGLRHIRYLSNQFRAEKDGHCIAIRAKCGKKYSNYENEELNQDKSVRRRQASTSHASCRMNRRPRQRSKLKMPVGKT